MCLAKNVFSKECEVDFMRFTKADIKLLMSWGYTEEDIAQIKDAAKAKHTVYLMGGKQITAEQAIAVLGRSSYLSGLCHSAFYYFSEVSGKNGEVVCFDSEAMFC